MKESKVVLTIIIILILMIAIPISNFYITKKVTEKKQLEKATNIIKNSEKNEIEVITNKELEANENIIGIIEIPKLNLSAPIQEGTSQEILKVAVGHFEESSLWNGNVALASHNRSIYVHYFERINELQDGDEIIYKTKLGIRKYIVYENKVIESTDWSVIENTQENILTLITCVKNSSDKRLCIRAKEENEIEENTAETIEQPSTIENTEEINNEIQIDISPIVNGNIDNKQENVQEENKEPEHVEIEPPVEEKIKLDFSKYDRYYPALNGGYTCFNKSIEGIANLRTLIENITQEFGYTNVNIVEDNTIIKNNYFTANRTNVQNMVYGTDGFTIRYYAETEYTLSETGVETVFQIRSYIQITGQ